MVPGATVVRTNEGTGVSFQTTTGASGAYTFESVQVGTYSVAAGNRVTIGVPTTVNVVLPASKIDQGLEIL